MTVVVLHEPSDFHCERGHRLRKYYWTPNSLAHDLLCPHCDADVIASRTQELVERYAHEKPSIKRDLPS